MWRIFKKHSVTSPAAPHWGLPQVAPAELDHVIHAMRLSGDLAKLTKQQVTNIAYALAVAGHGGHIKNVSEAAYNDGHLISFHNADFLTDPLFKEAYRLGEATDSWSGYRIPWRVFVLCWAAAHATCLEGDFVECGVNRGGFSKAVMHYVDFSRIVDKRFYLLDTYCGIPADDRSFAAPGCIDLYRECYEEVCATFAPFPNARLIRGRVPETLPLVTSEKICYLSIDMNCAEPEIAAVEFFWERLVAGAIIVLDDYGAQGHVRQKDAFDSFARHRGLQVLALPTCQGLIIKP